MNSSAGWTICANSRRKFFRRDNSHQKQRHTSIGCCFPTKHTLYSIHMRNVDLIKDSKASRKSGLAPDKLMPFDRFGMPRDLSPCCFATEILNGMKRRDEPHSPARFDDNFFVTKSRQSILQTHCVRMKKQSIDLVCVRASLFASDFDRNQTDNIWNLRRYDCESCVHGRLTLWISLLYGVLNK